ncbi:MAG: T9SS type A sorting domain-containing protein, partial [Bacteroidia bacterium]
THADGTISAVWTICPAGNPYTNRGTGYNYFDGSKWLYPDTVTHDVVNRLETIRTGFPTLGYLKHTQDIIVSHATTNYTNQEGLNTVKGAMPIPFFQTNSTLPLGTGPHGAIWPRIAIGGAGDSSIHMIANYSDTIAELQGVKQPMVYSRSQNSGTTWDIIAQPLPGLDSTRQLFGGGEEYAIAASGNNVAILSGGLGNHMTLWKSANNGTSWARTLVDSFPYTPDYSTMAPFGDDSIPTNDGSMDLMYDASNNIHVVYATSKVGRNATGGGIFVPGSIGLMYWNSITNTKVSIPIPLSAVDVDGDGFFRIGDSTTSATKCRYRNLSVLHIPNIAMDATGNIYVSFSMPADNDTTADQQGYRDVWVVSSCDNGMTWSAPVDVSVGLGLGSEDAFPVLAKRVDNYLHLLCMSDGEPGTALNNADPDGTNSMNYLRVDVATVICNVGIKPIDNNDLFFVGQNFPNPLNGQTTIPVNLARTSNMTITVTNIVGQKVLEVNAGVLNPGYHNLNVDATKLNAGIYFYTVKAGNYSVTKRMIVEN